MFGGLGWSIDMSGGGSSRPQLVTSEFTARPVEVMEALVTGIGRPTAELAAVKPLPLVVVAVVSLGLSDILTHCFLRIGISQVFFFSVKVMDFDLGYCIIL